jgi:glycosyltransferase involved in cell wall biosynthesis
MSGLSPATAGDDVRVPEPRVSVVIPTRNRAGRLAAALASLRAQTLPADELEVVVVDDGSDDGTAELLTAEAERDGFRLRAMHNGAPVGPAEARNAGWRAASAPLVAFLDDDCEAGAGWAEAGLAAWGGEPMRFVQGQTVPMRDEVDLIGPFSYTIDLREPHPAFPTCNMFYSRELLERVGGFDSIAFPTQGEDTDLAWRAQETGAEPVWAPGAEAEHAVVRLRPVEFLRRAWSWGNAAGLCARHPGFARRRLVYRVFWNPSHYELVRLVLALVLPRRLLLLPLQAWLARPYLTWRLGHPRTGRWAPWLLPWFLLVDTVEMAGVLRGSLRRGTFVI